MKNKDWKGNSASAHTALGVNPHTKTESVDREINDYYATDPKVVRMLLEHLLLPKNMLIWECACGEGHISEALIDLGYMVYSTDIVDRGYNRQNETVDFLQIKEKYYLYSNMHFDSCILTNPPYKYANEFIIHALELLPDGGYCIMLLNLNYLAGKERFAKVYENNNPQTVYVFTGRVHCAKNGNFEKKNNAINYAWFVWQKGYKGKTTIEWIEC